MRECAPGKEKCRVLTHLADIMTNTYIGVIEETMARFMINCL